MADRRLTRPFSTTSRRIACFTTVGRLGHPVAIGSNFVVGCLDEGKHEASNMRFDGRRPLQEKFNWHPVAPIRPRRIVQERRDSGVQKGRFWFSRISPFPSFPPFPSLFLPLPYVATLYQERPKL